VIDINIGLSAFANARSYYDRRKVAVHKRERTKETTEKARKMAEQKAASKLKQVRSGAEKTGVQHARKKLWCEKFHWFITSDNLIVVCGRDAQQNDLVVKRYLKPGDIYVHADVHGAGSCVIKNPFQKPVPPTSLQEAGAFAICRSAAW
jgi:nuclear export mediator factor NEMF